MLVEGVGVAIVIAESLYHSKLKALVDHGKGEAIGPACYGFMLEKLRVEDRGQSSSMNIARVRSWRFVYHDMAMLTTGMLRPGTCLGTYLKR